MTDDDKAVLELARHWVETTTEPSLMHPNNVRALLEMHDAQAVEIDRLKGELATRTQERDAALASATRGWEVADSFHVQKAIARTPSEQVAEDLEWISAAVGNRLMRHWMGHTDYDRSATEPQRRAEVALTRIAAKARGYESAVADNAALVGRAQEIAEDESNILEWRRAAHAILGNELHPGTAFLKQMQEQAETIKALADALKKSATRDDDGPCWCPPGLGPSPHEDFCTERREALCRAGRLP